MEKKETKRPTQESLGSGKSITFMGIVVIWGNAFTLILRFFRHEVTEKHQDFRSFDPVAIIKRIPLILMTYQTRRKITSTRCEQCGEMVDMRQLDDVLSRRSQARPDIQYGGWEQLGGQRNQ
jgi:hypothetical protein